VSSRVSPAERLRHEIDEVFASGVDLAGAVEQGARLGAQLLQAALEAEVTAFLGRERYVRAADTEDGRAGLLIRRDGGPYEPLDRQLGAIMAGLIDLLNQFLREVGISKVSLERANS
jgi:hypothetical protein